MLRKFIPAFLAIAGLGIGIAAGLFLRPVPEAVQVVENPQANPVKHPTDAARPAQPSDYGTAAGQDAALTPEYVKLNNQFVVPVLQDGKVVSMVVLALSLEVTPGGTEQVYAREPKLRDAILQVLFDHANSGGFMGEFTDGSNLIVLRKSLREVAQRTLGPVVVDVLISDIARQDS